MITITYWPLVLGSSALAPFATAQCQSERQQIFFSIVAMLWARLLLAFFMFSTEVLGLCNDEHFLY
jgi:hypothetical protein